MIVTCTDIVAKIKNLPEHYAEHVHMERVDNKTKVCNTATVDSFTHATKTYTVGIFMTKNDGERKVVCNCDATGLCKHIVSFYAVAKRFKPDGSVEPTGVTTPKPDKGMKTPSEEIAGDELQQFALALRAMKVTVYAEIAALFDRLAKELQKMKAELKDKK